MLQLQQGHNATILLNKDKFLVMCMELTDANASQQDIAELWKVSLDLTNYNAYLHNKLFERNN